MWVTQVASATDINNFLKLRAHEMAEPHFNELAQQVKRLVSHTKTVFEVIEKFGDKGATGEYGVLFQRLLPGEWHLPFIQHRELLDDSWDVETRKLISAARCARTSYTTIEDGKQPSGMRDESIGHGLIIADPLHASPLEHQAEAMADRFNGNRYANFAGFRQFRTTLDGEKGGD